MLILNSNNMWGYFGWESLDLDVSANGLYPKKLLYFFVGKMTIKQWMEWVWYTTLFDLIGNQQDTGIKKQHMWMCHGDINHLRWKISIGWDVLYDSWWSIIKYLLWLMYLNAPIKLWSPKMRPLNKWLTWPLLRSITSWFSFHLLSEE